jgi:iron-sulfur cluster repair protein YtfE (RIC family)
MNEIADLLEECSTLRRDIAELEKLLGPQSDVGWNDVAQVDSVKFRAAQDQFSRDLTEHQAKVEQFLTKRIEQLGEGREVLQKTIHSGHRTINNLLAILRSISSLDDLEHVYRVRTVISRIREELETHLRYDEKVMYPLLSRNAAR